MIDSNVNLPNLTIITGGARSGKSQFAEQLALESGKPVCYIATMEEMESDAESVQRISKHRNRRPSEWHTVVAPFEADRKILEISEDFGVCIFDCLSLYISNILLREDALKAPAEGIEKLADEACMSLLDVISRSARIKFFVVTNEVGSGIVPENRIARLYRDLLGFSNQSLARAAGEVWLCCSGIPIAIKKNN